MGFLGDFLGGKDKSTSTSTYTPNVPDWLKQYYQQVGDTANQLGQTSAEDRVAGFTGDQTAAQDMIRNLVGQAGDNYNLSSSALQGLLGNQLGPNSYQSFMNPYINEVLQNQNNELVRTNDINRNNIRSNAAMTNAFGSGRADMMEQEANRNLNQQVSTNTATGMANAFNSAQANALQTFQANNSNVLNATNALSGLTNNTLNQANALNASGTQQQQLAQTNLDVPYNNLSFMSNILGQIPQSMYGATTTSQTETPSAGWGQQLLGAGLAAAGVFTGNPMLMAGGMNSLMNGGSSSSPLGVTNWSSNPMSAAQSASNGITWFADGGLVQNKASGGLASSILAKAFLPLAWTDDVEPYSEVDKTGRMVAAEKENAMTALRKAAAEEPKTRGEFLTKTIPSRVTTGLADMPQFMLNAYGKGVDNLIDAGDKYFNTPYSEIDKATQAADEARAAKAQQLRQEQAPKTSNNDGSGAPGEDDFMARVRDQGGLLPPPVTTSSAVNDVVNDVVKPTIDATSKIDPAAGNSSPLAAVLSKYAQSQSSTPDATGGSWKDRINLPLVAAGAAMMASKSPNFGQALGEGIAAGAGQLDKERTQSSKEKTDSASNAQKLLDTMINAQYKDEQLKLNKVKAENAADYMQTQSQYLKARTQGMAGDSRKALDFARKQTESEMKSFLMTPAALKMKQPEIDAMRSRLQQKYYNDYITGQFNSADDVATKTPDLVQSDLNDDTGGGVINYNDLAAKYGQQQ